MGDAPLHESTSSGSRPVQLGSSAKPGRVNWIEPDKLAFLWSQDDQLEPDHRMLVRLGFASIFVINGVIALLMPEEFTRMLADNAVMSRLGSRSHSTLVVLAALNDLALAGALLAVTRIRSAMTTSWVYSWMALWLAVVAVTKAMNLIW